MKNSLKIFHFFSITSLNVNINLLRVYFLGNRRFKRPLNKGSRVYSLL